ncbi:MAG: hypothetical protein ACQZ2J_06780 [Pseudomonas piscis]|uniref:Uncharacterized protein n=1 Tax=Pseudomonas piscis TaxID=2614538 RepID=A0ABY9NFN6_9PSED|nr:MULTISPECIES: hypothetical protein [Pseudomonas]WMN17311.1 hypothetical protein QL104_28875 [Pseudomonas piscis]
MRSSYLRHGLISLALTLLGALTVYLALQYEFRRKGEGEPELIMAFAYMAWYWALPALALPALGCALLGLRGPARVTRPWRWALAASYVPLLGLALFSVLVAIEALLENRGFIPVMLVGLVLSMYLWRGFPPAGVKPRPGA